MSKVKKGRYIFLGALLTVIVGVGLVKGWQKDAGRRFSRGEKLKVTTSFYPLYYFASEIGGDRVEVTNLTPAGAEPHDYELNARDLVRLGESKLVLINGVGLEPWADRVTSDLEGRNIKVVTAADGLAIGIGGGEKEKRKDPHVWLDPVLARQEVGKIMQALVEVDPQYRSVYEANGRKLLERLDALDREFRRGLSSCKLRTIITSHKASGYIAARYELEQKAIAGLSPDEEPSPATLGEIAKFAKVNNVKYIFFETLVSPRLAETVAREAGARTIAFNPLEGLTKEEQGLGRDYFSVQRENLDSLKTALNCTNI